MNNSIPTIDMFGTVAATYQQPCTEGAFSALLRNRTDATVNFVHHVPQNGSFGEGESNLAFPANATQLPALCAVSINVKSSETSSYNFGLFLPDTLWNSRFLATGNGGLGGGVNWIDMGMFSQYGFATMSTDTGHSSNAGDGTWGFNAPESLNDWGYRAMHGSVVLSKDIIAGYYGSASEYSYFASCSNGGRQGLKEVQLYPDSFDAIAVGAPAWWATRQAAATTRWSTLNYPPSKPHHIDPSLFHLAAQEMVTQCDPQDGLVDGIISDPQGCNFDFGALLCKDPDSSSCFTPDQLDILQMLYSDWVHSDQSLVFPAASLGADMAIMTNFPVPIGFHPFQYWIYNNTDWDYMHINYSDVQFADQVDPGNANTDNFDLSPYLERGGKIIMYHGNDDPLIGARSSLYFYNQVRKTLEPRGVDLDDFFRFYLVPGMGHCFGSSVAPWYIGGGFQTVTGATHSVPGYEDAKHDVILAMQQWAEAGVAPDALIASKFVGDDVSKGLERQRPICVYPEQAKYVGGDPDKAESWRCASLYKE